MTWLITGGSGQLGIALSRELANRKVLFNAFSSRELDVTQVSLVRDSIRELNPSVIVNCAAWTDVDGAETKEQEAFSVNATGAQNIALAAKECGAKLIHVSTDYVFSGNSTTPWKINDIKNPQTAYGRTKLAGEEKVLNAYPESTFLIRTAWLYSPWKKNFLNSVLQLSQKNKEQISMVNDQIGQPTSAIDLASKIIELVESPTKNGIFHGTNFGEASWFDFAAQIMKINEDRINRLIPIASSEFNQLAKRPAYSVLDHASWEQASLTPMRDWKDALIHTMRIQKLEKEVGLGNA
jgi:dTDP-4-dehydrorhamnose reductase